MIVPDSSPGSRISKVSCDKCRLMTSWYYTDDDRIAITGGNQCLDDDGTRLQTYQCTTGNTNQSELSLNSANKSFIHSSIMILPLSLIPILIFLLEPNSILT